MDRKINVNSKWNISNWVIKLCARTMPEEFSEGHARVGT